MNDPDISMLRSRRLMPSPIGLPRSGRVVMGFLTRRANYIYDPVTMLYATLSPGGVAHTAEGRWCAAAIAAASIAMAESVRRTGRNLFAMRVVMAIAAMVLVTRWADASHHSYSPLGVPVAVAISMYHGPRGLVVAAAAAVAGALTTSDQRVAINEAVAVLVLACVLGWGVSVYLSLRDRAIARQAALVEQARVAAAHHAGRSSILTASEGTADLVQRVGVLLSLHGSTVGRVVGDMKRRAAEDIGNAGAFLTTVAAGWSARRNRTPDLRHTVDVLVAADASRMLLTQTQADHVTAALDELGPNATVTLRLERGNPQRIDRSRLLAVGDAIINIPAERTTRTWAVSPLPVAAAMVAMWMLHPALGGLMEAPLVAVGFAAIALVHAARVHHLVTLDDLRVARAVNEVVALFVAFSIACIPLSNPWPGNAQVTWPPAEGAAEFVVLVLLIARPHLPPWQQRSIPAYLLLLVGLNTLSFASTFNWRNAIAEALFVPAMYAAASGIGEAVEQVAQDTNAEYEERSRRAADQAFVAGRESVRLELIDQLAQLESEFARHRDSMDDDLAVEIQRRISEAERVTASG